MLSSMRAGNGAFFAAAAFLFGVFAANAHWNLVLVGMIGIAVAFALPWRYAALIFLAAGIGVVYYYAYLHWRAAHTHMPSGKNAAFFGVITEEPKPAGNFFMLAADLSRPYAGTIDIFLSPNNTEFSYGDRIWIEGTVDIPDTGGEPPTVFLPRVHVVAQHEGFWLKAAMIEIKEGIVRELARVLPSDQAALLAAILAGTASGISVPLKAQMDASGTTYIVGMYGYKIAIITSMIAAALKDRLSRRTLLWITLFAVALFVFASGGTISAVRAAIMGSFAVIARGMGRIFSARNAVIFSATIMVITNATLLTDAGFQLSFLSFLGIYYLGPPIDIFFHWTDGGMFQWKEHAMLSLSTNLAILPIVMSAFGGFSLTSFISNVFIMIPWAIVLALGVPLVIFGFIMPPLAFIVAQVVGVFLRYELFIIRLFAEYTIAMPAIFGSPIAVALYYGMLILFAYYYAAPSQKVY